MSRTILFAAPLPAAILDLARGMAPAAFDIRFHDQNAAGFLDTVREADYLVTGFVRGGMGKEFYGAAPRLRLVQLIGAGYDRLDVEAARAAGVPIATNGGSNSVAVAEHTLLLMLAVMRRLPWQHANVAAGRWRVGDFSEVRFHELAGATLGIVGMGAIGRKVARRAQAFDMDTQYYDPFRLPQDEEDRLGVPFVLFDELLATSDVVTLHMPLTPATRSMIGARELGLMKTGAILINTSRGGIIDEAALHDALVARRLAGAGLDVLAAEPPPADHPLLALDTVVLTPHTAGPTWENWTKSFRNAFDNVQRVAAGRPPLWVIPELR